MVYCKLVYFIALGWHNRQPGHDYNVGQNICRLFHFLVQFFFTTTETELNYYHQKVNVQVASQVAEDLGSYKIKKFDGEYPTAHQNARFWCFSVKTRKKSALNLSTAKPILLNFAEFVYNLLSKIVWGNRSLFLTRSRPLDFTFFWRFYYFKRPIRSSNWYLTQLSFKNYQKMVSFKKHYFVLSRQLWIWD